MDFSKRYYRAPEKVLIGRTTELALLTEGGIVYFRFDGTWLSGYPKNLRFKGLMDREWQDCPNVSRGNQIAKILAAPCKNHSFSRLTMNSKHCTICGQIHPYSQEEKS
jgi:hypothetical protein